MNGLRQWDLCSTSDSALKASKQVISVGTTTVVYGSMQLATNGKIYVAAQNQSSLAVINSPNLPGSLCGFTPYAVNMGSGICRNGLPNFISPREKAHPMQSLTCGSATFSLSASAYCPLANYSITSQKWIFGDPSSGSADTSYVSGPAHLYNKNGNYVVKLITYYPCFVDTTFDTVVVSGLPPVTITGKTKICLGEQVTLTAGGANSYSWNTGQQSGTILLAPGANTVYVVTGFDANGCQSTQQFSLVVDECLGLNDPKRPGAWNIYPNPGNGMYKVVGANNSRIEVFTIQGLHVLTFQADDGPVTLNVSDQPDGIYFVRLSGSTKANILVKQSQ